MNKVSIRSGFSFLIVALLFAAYAHAQNAEPLPGVPLTQWLGGADRRDFDWKVQLRGPWLTFQQRYVAQVRMVVSIRNLKRAGISLPDLHLVVKVANEEGHWFPGQDYSRFDPAADIGKASEIFFFAYFYVQPGKYTIAAMAYDSRNRRGNLTKIQLQVPVPQNDPLPEVNRNFPQIEFASSETEVKAWTSQRIDWTAEQTRLFLPVENVRPIQLDIVTNLSLSDAWNTPYGQAPDWVYQTNAGLLLQMSKVLTQLDLKRGCVRFSAVDILRQTAFADRVPSADINWNKLTRTVASVQRNKIDVRVLKRQKVTPALFARFLEQASAGAASCEQPSQKALHILIVVSDAFVFPTKTEMTAVRPELFPDGSYYFLQVNPARGAHWDQMERVLRPLHPTRLEFSNAVQFRKVLAQLIASIESVSRESGTSPAGP